MEITSEPRRSGPRGTPTRSYWSRNLTRLALLLSVWFFGSYGASILFADSLDRIQFFGFPLGFWFAQQGSILIFLVLIVIYARTMNALDDEYVNPGPPDVADQDGSDSESGSKE